MRIRHLHKTKSEFAANRTVRVKLSGDGTNIGKRPHVIHFTLIYSFGGGKPRVFKQGEPYHRNFKHEEKYEPVRDALQDICAEVERLKEITVHGRKYTIEYYL